jgi:protein-S-isoprenylcysteine O-methyltransferase Ste14
LVGERLRRSGGGASHARSGEPCAWLGGGAGWGWGWVGATIRPMDYLVLALAWGGCCALHSAMISEAAVRVLKHRLGALFRYYRLFFNLVALATFVPVALYTRSLEREPFFSWEQSGLVLVRYALLTCAVVLFVAGGRHYSLMQFIGIGQLRGASSGGLAEGGGIDARGVLGLVRHPWYTGVLLLLWAGDLDGPRLVVSIVLTVYVFVGTILEERKLVHEFGDAYRAYQERVSMFVPLKWLRDRAISRT